MSDADEHQLHSLGPGDPGFRYVCGVCPPHDRCLRNKMCDVDFLPILIWCGQVACIENDKCPDDAWRYCGRLDRAKLRKEK